MIVLGSIVHDPKGEIRRRFRDTTAVSPLPSPDL